MSKVWCPKCETWYDCIKIGIVFDIDEFTVMKCDLLRCKKCGNEILADFGRQYQRVKK